MSTLQIQAEQHQQYKRKSALMSVAIHVVLVALIFLINIKPDMPEEEEGGELLISLGVPDLGSGRDNPLSTTTNNTNPEPAMDEGPVSTPDMPQVQHIATPPPVKTAPAEDLTSEDDESVKLKEEQERKRKQDADAVAEDNRRRIEAEETSRREATEKAKRDAEEKARKDAEFKKAKDSYGGMFKNNGQSGSGRGNTDKPGNQGSASGSNLGDPDGSPSGSKLDGIGGSGKGRIGGGLSGRKVLSAPRPVDNTQKTGRIVVKVCVDGDGRVISSEYTQAGSTSNDGDLRKLAETNARSYKFDPQPVDKQCGTITYDFRVK